MSLYICPMCTGASGSKPMSYCAAVFNQDSLVSRVGVVDCRTLNVRERQLIVSNMDLTQSSLEIWQFTEHY
jgi:hypothetical protein